jgi:hypothetical protein
MEWDFLTYVVATTTDTQNTAINAKNAFTGEYMAGWTFDATGTFQPPYPGGPWQGTPGVARVSKPAGWVATGGTPLPSNPAVWFNDAIWSEKWS